MHMADTLISPVVGGVMWAATAGAAAYSMKKMKGEFDDRKVPLMGVMGAFIFAAQMINFSIPGTGSSGHLGGGMILAILLGPFAGFLTIASVLVVQALFFADGGLLALGANIFNLGFFPCFVAFPLIFRSIAGRGLVGGGPGAVQQDAGAHGSPGRSVKALVPASILASIVGLQLGAFGVVVETISSGISNLPFSKFLLLMQPIHLAIGVVEGFVTAGIVSYVYRAKPDILEGSIVRGGPAASALSGDRPRPAARPAMRKVLLVLGALAVVTGVVFSWFASTHPDGLEWSVFRVTGSEEVARPGSGIHAFASRLQQRMSFLPDYGFKKAEEPVTRWPAVDAGSSVSGLVGGAFTLCLAGIAGFFLLKKRGFAKGRSRRAEGRAGKTPRWES